MELHQCPLNNDEKLRMISEAAYYHSQNRSASDTDPVQDWMIAASEFEDALIRQCSNRDDSANHGRLAKAKSKLLDLFEKIGKSYLKSQTGYEPFRH